MDRSWQPQRGDGLLDGRKGIRQRAARRKIERDRTRHTLAKVIHLAGYPTLLHSPEDAQRDRRLARWPPCSVCRRADKQRAEDRTLLHIARRRLHDHMILLAVVVHRRHLALSERVIESCIDIRGRNRELSESRTVGDHSGRWGRLLFLSHVSKPCISLEPRD